jgi:predicted LPLAT superfamily acyltransferase
MRYLWETANVAEQVVKEHPEQWVNFYGFWEAGKTE